MILFAARLYALFRCMALSITWLVLAPGLHVAAHAQPSIAFTFDDGFNATENNPVAQQYNTSMLATLRNQGVKAMLFPLGALADNPYTMALVHARGNHWQTLPHITHALRQQGWRIIDPSSAFSDPIYQRVLAPPSGNEPAYR